MPISITCKCGKQLMASDALAGKRGQCPRCGAVYTVPAHSASAAPPPPACPPAVRARPRATARPPRLPSLGPEPAIGEVALRAGALVRQAVSLFNQAVDGFAAVPSVAQAQLERALKMPGREHIKCTVVIRLGDDQKELRFTHCPFCGKRFRNPSAAPHCNLANGSLTNICTRCLNTLCDYRALASLICGALSRLKEAQALYPEDSAIKQYLGQVSAVVSQLPPSWTSATHPSWLKRILAFDLSTLFGFAETASAKTTSVTLNLRRLEPTGVPVEQRPQRPNETNGVPNNEPAIAMLASLERRVRAYAQLSELAGTDGDIHPGICANINEAMTDLRSGSPPAEKVASGLKRMAEYVESIGLTRG